MKDKLLRILKNYETKEIGAIFETYMKSIGARKWDRRRNDNSNTYSIDGDCTNWNRVECYYYKNEPHYSDEDLEIVLRKRAGYYLIIAKKGERAFEAGYEGIIHYDEELLKEIISENKPLFEKLGVI
jgi:hypothetical protein